MAILQAALALCYTLLQISVEGKLMSTWILHIKFSLGKAGDVEGERAQS